MTPFKITINPHVISIDLDIESKGRPKSRTCYISTDDLREGEKGEGEAGRAPPLPERTTLRKNNSKL